MYLNIITPCSRPENLHKIAESINIPKDNYRWIVVCDLDELPNAELIPKNCEIYTHRNKESVAGHSQRNFALDMITQGYIYMQDDDTLMHPELWQNIKELTEDFIHFKQSFPDGNLRLNIGRVETGHIDSHNFIVNFNVFGDLRWEAGNYCADGAFAEKCMAKNKFTFIAINKVLSIYNSLR